MKLAGKVREPCAREMVTTLSAYGERLAAARHFEHPLRELGQFVEEEHAAMGERDLARPRPVAAAHQSRMSRLWLDRPK
jgi:hypothetical protein